MSAPPPKPGLKKAPPGKVLVKKGVAPPPGAKSPSSPQASPTGTPRKAPIPSGKSSGVKAVSKMPPSPGSKSPGGTPTPTTTAKSPGKAMMVKGPDGKLVMKRMPPSAAGGDGTPRAAVAAPSPKKSLAVPQGTPGGKVPPGKLTSPPGKMPLKAPAGKLPLKSAAAPGKAPLKVPPKLLGKKPPVPPSAGLIGDAVPSTPIEGTRDTEDPSALPIATPREMPSASALPPETPTEFGGSPRERVDLLLTPTSGEIPIVDEMNLPSTPLGTNTINLQTPVQPPQGEPEWPVHQSGSVHQSAGSSSVHSQEMETQKRITQQLEVKLAQSEGIVHNLQSECSRLRETLYERDGVKVVHHIAELERENNYLRIQLTREKDQGTRHQSARLATMDELVEVKNTMGPSGDYSRVQRENVDLHNQIAALVRANTQLSLRIADVDQTLTLSNIALDASDSRIKESEKSTYVRVRRGSLCPHCIEMINRLETIMLRRQIDRTSQPVAVGPYTAGVSSRSQQLLQSLAVTPPKASGGAYLPPHGVMTGSPYSGAAHGSSSSSSHLDPAAIPRSFGSPPYRGGGHYYQEAATPTVLSPMTPVKVGPTGTPAMTNVASEGWRVLRLPNGNTVYHNIISNRSQLEAPPQLGGSGPPRL